MRIQRTFPLIVFLSLILAGCDFSSMMIHEAESPYGHEETIAAIKQNAAELGWKVPKEYDFQALLIKHNQPDPGRISVIKLCHPEIAARMLAQDENKFVSAMMPCSIGVYEKQDGKTYVASMNMKLMSKVMGSSVGPILNRVAENDAQILAFLKE